MSIQSMRNATKNKKWVMVVVVCALIVGLLITYAATANQSGGISSNDLQAQIEAYNNAIEATKQDLTETPDDFSLLSNLGEQYYNLAVAYSQQASTAESEQKLAEADIAMTNAQESLNQSAGYYIQALDHAPEALNDKGRADILMKIGGSYLLAGDSSKGNDYLRQGLEKAPLDFDNNVLYAQYMLLQGRTAEAQATLEYYKEQLPEGDANIANIDTMLENLQAQLDAEAKAAEDANEQIGVKENDNVDEVAPTDGDDTATPEDGTSTDDNASAAE